jgi:proteasome lid subunit RPN8/RPN11
VILSERKESGVRVPLIVTEQQLKVIRGLAEVAYPEECCGVLLGTRNTNDREVVEVVPCENVALTRRSRYEVHVLELVRAQLDGRQRGLDIVGIYHSHPDHPARWSATDLRDAEWVGCSYLIVEVRAGRAHAQGSFELVNDGEKKEFLEEDVKVLSA